MNVDDLFNLIGRQQAQIYQLERSLAALRKLLTSQSEQQEEQEQATEDDS